MVESFTPGPWVVIESGFHGDSYLVCVDQPGRLNPICAMEHLHPQAEANAKLVAAAPALLEALKEVSDMLFARPDMVAKLHPMMGFAEKEIFNRAQAAIALALSQEGVGDA